MLLLLVVPIMLFQRMQRRELEASAMKSRAPASRGPRSCSGFVFLYVPIVSMVVFSFNDSRLVTVWERHSRPKWYGELLHNGQILGAAWLSHPHRAGRRPPAR